MLSKTAKLHADRAVRSIARTYQDAPARYTPALYANEHAEHEQTTRGYRYTANANVWLDYVRDHARTAIENRIQAGAPNAANAAPLMPLCAMCHGTGIEPKRMSHGLYAPVELGGGSCPYCDGTGRERATREGFPSIIRPGHLGADEQLPAYAWPGGYPLIYLPGTVYPGDPDLINTNSIILCAECATQSLHNPGEWSDEEGMTSAIEDGDLEQDTVCDGCNAIIAHQNYCYECHECVDTEDAPHLCPKTEPYDVWYLLEAPGDHWKRSERRPSGPEEAATIARELRAMPGVVAFVHVQPARLDFPPAPTEEEE